MKSMYTWYKNLRFRKKITILCIAVSLIPTVVLGMFCTVQCRNLLIAQEEAYLHNTLEKTNSSLNYYLMHYANIIDTVAWDESIRNAVNKEYQSNYEMFLANQEVFDVKLPMVCAMHKDMTGLTLYTGTNLYPHGNMIAPIEDIMSEVWYEQALTAVQPFFVADKERGALLIIHAVPNIEYPNILVGTLSYDAVFREYQMLFENDYAIGIYDPHGQLTFQYMALSPQYMEKPLIYETLTETNQQVNYRQFFMGSTNQNEFGYTLCIFRPLHQITASSKSFIWIILFVVLGSTAAVFYFSMRLSRHIVNPLERLTTNLDHIQVDDFTVTVQSKYNDEIAHLIHAFNKMANRLKSTIDELYVNRLMKQEYQLQMLQSQINPHFLYNCLSMINSKAIRTEQPEIGRIALLLSSFYRTTLNKGRSAITVREEWNNMLAYMELQKILHSNSFEVVCQIDERLFPYQIINLVIQPLVENAVLHGIDYREDSTEPGWVSVTGELEETWMKLTVSDNGCGMDEETMSHILVTETKGYGIRNVNQRIQLYFGESYGITYENREGGGIRAIIRLPLLLK